VGHQVISKLAWVGKGLSDSKKKPRLAMRIYRKREGGGLKREVSSNAKRASNKKCCEGKVGCLKSRVEGDEHSGIFGLISRKFKKITSALGERRPKGRELKRCESDSVG